MDIFSQLQKLDQSDVARVSRIFSEELLFDQLTVFGWFQFLKLQKINPILRTIVIENNDSAEQILQFWYSEFQGQFVFEMQNEKQNQQTLIDIKSMANQWFQFSISFDYQQKSAMIQITNFDVQKKELIKVPIDDQRKILKGINFEIGCFLTQQQIEKKENLQSCSLGFADKFFFAFQYYQKLDYFYLVTQSKNFVDNYVFNQTYKQEIQSKNTDKILQIKNQSNTIQSDLGLDQELVYSFDTKLNIIQSPTFYFEIYFDDQLIADHNILQIQSKSSQSAISQNIDIRINQIDDILKISFFLNENLLDQTQNSIKINQYNFLIFSVLQYNNKVGFLTKVNQNDIFVSQFENIENLNWNQVIINHSQNESNHKKIYRFTFIDNVSGIIISSLNNQKNYCNTNCNLLTQYSFSQKQCLKCDQGKVFLSQQNRCLDFCPRGSFQLKDVCTKCQNPQCNEIQQPRLQVTQASDQHKFLIDLSNFKEIDFSQINPINIIFRDQNLSQKDYQFIQIDKNIAEFILDNEISGQVTFDFKDNILLSDENKNQIQNQKVDFFIQQNRDSINQNQQQEKFIQNAPGLEFQDAEKIKPDTEIQIIKQNNRNNQEQVQTQNSQQQEEMDSQNNIANIFATENDEQQENFNGNQKITQLLNIIDSSNNNPTSSQSVSQINPILQNNNKIINEKLETNLPNTDQNKSKLQFSNSIQDNIIQQSTPFFEDQLNASSSPQIQDNIIIDPSMQIDLNSEPNQMNQDFLKTQFITENSKQQNQQDISSQQIDQENNTVQQRQQNIITQKPFDQNLIQEQQIQQIQNQQQQYQLQEILDSNIIRTQEINQDATTFTDNQIPQIIDTIILRPQQQIEQTKNQFENFKIDQQNQKYNNNLENNIILEPPKPKINDSIIIMPVQPLQDNTSLQQKSQEITQQKLIQTNDQISNNSQQMPIITDQIINQKLDSNKNIQSQQINDEIRDQDIEDYFYNIGKIVFILFMAQFIIGLLRELYINRNFNQNSFLYQKWLQVFLIGQYIVFFLCYNIQLPYNFKKFLQGFFSVFIATHDIFRNSIVSEYENSEKFQKVYMNKDFRNFTDNEISTTLLINFGLIIIIQIFFLLLVMFLSCCSSNIKISISGQPGCFKSTINYLYEQLVYKFIVSIFILFTVEMGVFMFYNFASDVLQYPIFGILQFSVFIAFVYVILTVSIAMILLLNTEKEYSTPDVEFMLRGIKEKGLSRKFIFFQFVYFILFTFLLVVLYQSNQWQAISTFLLCFVMFLYIIIYRPPRYKFYQYEQILFFLFLLTLHILVLLLAVDEDNLQYTKQTRWNIGWALAIVSIILLVYCFIIVICDSFIEIYQYCQLKQIDRQIDNVNEEIEQAQDIEENVIVESQNVIQVPVLPLQTNQQNFSGQQQQILDSNLNMIPQQQIQENLLSKEKNEQTSLKLKKSTELKKTLQDLKKRMLETEKKIEMKKRLKDQIQVKRFKQGCQDKDNFQNVQKLKNKKERISSREISQIIQEKQKEQEDDENETLLQINQELIDLADDILNKSDKQQLNQKIIF